MFSLRDYQRMALDHVQQRLQQGERRLYISLPTGTGKSVLMAGAPMRLHCPYSKECHYREVTKAVPYLSPKGGGEQ